MLREVRMKQQMLLTGKQQGLTLVEVLIALVLIGLITGITLPNFNQLLASVEGKAAQRQVVSIFKKLRTKAVTEGVQQKVEVRKDGFNYQTPTGAELSFKANIKDVKLEQGSSPILFYPNGSSSGAELSVRTKNGRQLKIEVDRITAEVVVEVKE